MVEERLSSFLKELYGVGISVEGFEDISLGWETQIIAFRLLSPNVGPLELVIKIYEGAQAGKKAKWEYDIMYKLDAIGYPVPKVYAYKSTSDLIGSPLLLMERIRGVSLWDVFFKSSREEYGDVLSLNVRLMARLHCIPVNEVVPAIHYQNTISCILDRIQGESKSLKKHELGEAFEPLISWLSKNLSALTEYPACIIHQDFHPRNILIRSGGLPVIIDWANCTVGDFREDLCWMGLLSGTFIDESLKEEIYDLYQHASSRSLMDLPFFEAYAGLRRLADMAVTFKAGPTSRGMRAEAIKEMEGNRLHYSRVLEFVTEVIGVELPYLAHMIEIW